MNCAPTLTAEEFKTVHNALCELREIEMRLNTVLSADMVDRLHRVVKSFESGLTSAYAQDNAEFDSKMDYFSGFKAENGLQSIWSLFELPVHGFLQNHPYPSDAFVVYRDHWGDGPALTKHYPVMGPTWGDVYRAADLAIKESGDGHHCFIEGFRVKNGNELHMYTGS